MNKKLLGEKIVNDMKDKYKDLENYSVELKDKMNCCKEIFSLLEKYEKIWIKTYRMFIK